jgi:hypothetical protein
MLQLHPETLTKNGQDFVVLPYAEFQQIQKLLEDLEDWTVRSLWMPDKVMTMRRK